MPDTTFPNFDVNKAANDLNNALKEGAYVAIGLGVLGFQRAQVQRVELTKQLEAQWAQLSNLPNTLNEQIANSPLAGYAQTARAQAEATRTQLAEQLSELSKSLEEALAPARAQLAKAIPNGMPNFDLPSLPDFGKQLNQASETVEEQLASARAQLAELAKTVDEAVQPVRKQIDEQIDRLEEYLPATARGVVQSVRAAAATPEGYFRSAVGLD